ncbi:hypothetical protein LA52FAK_25340 [Desulforhopalus sp. 52FAK]
MFNLWQGYFQEQEKYFNLGLIVPVFNLIIVIALLVVYFTFSNVNYSIVIATYFGISCVVATVSLLVLWKKTKEVIGQNDSLHEMSRMVVKNIGVTLLFFLFRSLDLFFLKFFTSFEAVGVYSAALRTSMLLSILVSSLPTILLPKAIDATKSKKLLFIFIRKSYSLVSLIVLVFIVFIYFSSDILTFLYGGDYINAAYTLKILVVSWCATALYIPIMQLMYAFNRVGLRFILEVIRLLICVVLFVFLIPKFGGVGAAWALVFSTSVILVVGACVVIYISLFTNNLSQPPCNQ